MDVRIRPESLSDLDAIRAVNRAAFERDDEGRLVDQLRAAGDLQFSFVAQLGPTIIGHIAFPRLLITTASGSRRALGLAPMAVLPSHQRQGIGSQLIQHALLRCKEHGHELVIVLGHPDYYPRFGFSAEKARALTSPFGGGDAWMVLELVPGAMSNIEGHVEYPAAFFEL